MRALVRGRRLAESLMVDSCRIDRATGETTIDPDTLAEVPVYAPVLTGQRCRVQRFTGQGRNDRVVGGVEYGDAALILQLPIGTRGVRRDDRVTVTAVAPESDPELIGTVAIVRADLSKTHATKRTLMCEEVL